MARERNRGGRSMNIILSEKKCAEYCLLTGKIIEKPKYSLKILASYFYYELGYNKRRIEIELMDFLERSSKKYRENIRYWVPIVETLAKNADQYILYEVGGVWITKKELSVISEIRGKQVRKVAFVLLCLAKFGNARNEENCNWVNFGYPEIFKMARYNCKHDERCWTLHKLYESGLIGLAAKLTNTSLQVKFVDEDAGYNDSDIFIDDFRELGYRYQMISGDNNIIACADCGVLIPRGPMGNRKYCDECSGRVPVQYKSIECVDCGNIFVRPMKSRQIRCPKCAEKERNRINREKMKKWRENHVTLVRGKVTD